MTEPNHNNQHHSQDASPDNPPPVELDAASRSLSEAFRMSFIILKIIMIVLVVLFVISGFETIDSDEQALVLRFGKIRGVGENKILKPRARPYWVFPYPIEEIIKIPVAKKVDLSIRSFWFHQSEQDIIDERSGTPRPPRLNTLDPIRDGYCLTRSEKRTDDIGDSDGSDYNIIHSKWQLTYQIDNPELFFTNVYVDDLKPGEIYLDVMTKSITPLLKNLLDDAVVDAMVHYTIDEAIRSQDTIPVHVMRLVQEKLNAMKVGDTENMCGIKVVSVYLTDITWPRQQEVNDAFQVAHAASQDSQKAISEATTYARNILNEAAGPVADQLFASLRDENMDEQTRELLWSRLSGTAHQRMLDAEAYRTRIAAEAEADAKYFLNLLPEFRKHPKIVVQSIYRDAIKQVFADADEKFVVQLAEGDEIRIYVNRDPTIKKRPKSERGSETTQE